MGPALAERKRRARPDAGSHPTGCHWDDQLRRWVTVETLEDSMEWSPTLEADVQGIEESRVVLVYDPGP